MPARWPQKWRDNQLVGPHNKNNNLAESFVDHFKYDFISFSDL